MYEGPEGVDAQFEHADASRFALVSARNTFLMADNEKDSGRLCFPKAIGSSATWRGEILAKPTVRCVLRDEHVVVRSAKTCPKSGDR